MNLPAIQRIAMEFERENDMMDQRQEMMEDAIDDSFEDEEEESDEIVNQVLDEIGVDLTQQVMLYSDYTHSSSVRLLKVLSINNLARSIKSLKRLVRMTIYRLDWIVYGND
jgi:division protein CdvB (Snf7/Vps24/ESCRT-III family)